MTDRTISADFTVPRVGKREGARSLLLLLECDRPTAGSSRHSLDGVEEVVLGRGPAREVIRSDDGRRLELRVPDALMSGRHARLLLEGDRFVLEDTGSKNGSLVNDRKQDRVELTEGDVLALGSTFFLYCDAGPAMLEADLAPASTPVAGISSLEPRLRDRFEALRTIARSPISVLVLGESGTGKELIARAVHDMSGRTGAFVAVNCGAIPANLVESELFGFKKGAFSGATEDRIGLFRASDGGTLFLDEIGDLPTGAQATLLRVLQTREVMAIGTTHPVRVDLRVVAATHRDLDGLVSTERFRADLLARLKGFEIQLPPLRERREDMGIIVASISAHIERSSGVAVTYSPDAMQALLRYAWPLNVRELEQCVSTAVALGRGRVLLQNLPDRVRQADADDHRQASSQEPRTLSDEQKRRRDELIALLEKHQGNVAAVAREMGKDRAQIHRWLRAYTIELDRYRDT
jgi:transcriptional regulator with GAF, ATPase, and Fis domain